MDSNFSLLKQPWSQPSRPLHIALAHCLAAAKIGDEPRQALLHRIFLRLSWLDQRACRAELYQCKQAMRGQHEAIVC